MAVIIGHASIDENGKTIGGAVGDQTGKEVCTRSYYMHSKGWYLLRPKSVVHANLIAEAMLRACNNNNIGYDQGNRLGIIKYGTNTTTKTECDCGTLVRQCVKEGTGVDAGNFTTANEVKMLQATGLFETAIAVTSSTVMYNGDILITKTKGHTVIVVSGNPRPINTTYTQEQFIKEIQAILGGQNVTETLSKTVTVSTWQNKRHAVVTPLERYMKALGYYNGEIEADEGKKQCFGSGMKKAIKKYQEEVVMAEPEFQDGVITKKANTWKKLLGI